MLERLFSKQTQSDQNSPPTGKSAASTASSLPPRGHENYLQSDQESCPYLQIQGKLQKLQDAQVQMAQNGEHKQVPPEKRKAKKAKGGCPFMTSEKKRNPPLGTAIAEAWNEEFISQYSYLLDYKGFDVFRADSLEVARSLRPIDKMRKNFDAYPIYLKHTLMHNEESMRKVRRCEVSQRFFAYDKFRERGNKLFQREQYSDAIACYERALGVFKWLEFIDEEEEQMRLKVQAAALEKKRVINEQRQKEEELQQQQQQQNASNRAQPQSALSVIQSKIQEGVSEQQNNLYQRILAERRAAAAERQSAHQFWNGEGAAPNEDEAHSIRSDEAIDDDEDHFEREVEDMRENMEAEEKERQIEELMKEDGEGAEEEEEEEQQQQQQDTGKGLQQKQKQSTRVVVDREAEEERRQQKRREAEQIQRMKEEDKEFRKKYRDILTTYHDGNVRLFDGEELTEANDIDMRRSMLLTVYLNIAVAYMKLQHFSNARVALDDAFKVTEKASQVYFRRSQALAYDRWSGLPELYRAKEDIERAIHIKEYEKIFKSDAGMLNLMNLSNHNEVYIQQAHYVMKRIDMLKKSQYERIVEMLENEREIEEVYQEMRAEGLLPPEQQPTTQAREDGEILIDSDEDEEAILRQDEKEQMERQVVLIMMKKYYDIIDFYQESQRADQIQLAKRELQRISEVYSGMRFYLTLDFENPEKQEVLASAYKEFKTPYRERRTLRRLRRIRTERVKELYESQPFNFELFEYALKEYYRLKEEREAKSKKKKGLNLAKNDSSINQSDDGLKKQQRGIFSNQRERLSALISFGGDGLFTLETFLQGLFLLLFVVVLFYFGTSDSTLLQQLFQQMQSPDNTHAQATHSGKN